MKKSGRTPPKDTASEQTPAEVVELCERCNKPPKHCICSSLKPLTSRLKVLVLQHPREKKQLLNSTFIPALTMPHCVVRIGLSWPNLAKAWGEPTNPKEWTALFIGKRGTKAPAGEILTLLTKQGEPRPDRVELLPHMRGVIILDGTWAEAKTLWWRNSWLSKITRSILTPPGPRMYGDLRRAARQEGVSSAESAAWAAEALGGDDRTRIAILSHFETFLKTFGNYSP